MDDNRHARRSKNNTNNNNNNTVPLSLGKPSLRRRLEQYYAQVAPQQTTPTTEWLAKLDQIYDKYGGSIAGEEKLARKLAKKYGHRVLLETVGGGGGGGPAGHDATNNTRANDGDGDTSVSPKTKAMPLQQHNEEYYAVREGQRGSATLNLLDANVDILEVLRATNHQEVERTNPWLNDQNDVPQSSSSTTKFRGEKEEPLAVTPGSLLDRVALFAAYLPFDDPLSTAGRTKNNNNNKRRRNPVSRNLPSQPLPPSSESTTKRKQTFNVPRCYAEIAEAACEATESSPYNNNTKGGPMSLLWQAMEERFAVRFLIRTSGGRMRGTLTGLVAAVDKHYNVLLQDVTEVYSTRKGQAPTRTLATPNTSDVPSANVVENSKSSNLELEIQRRRGQHRRRTMSQLLVRGDQIVLAYRASAEAPCASSSVSTPGFCTMIQQQQQFRGQGEDQQVPKKQRRPVGIR